MKIPGYGVGLLQLRSAPPAGPETAAGAGPGPGETGWLHLVFTVPDADRTYHMLEDRGAEPFLRHGQSSSPITVFMLRDSEGNEIEIAGEQQ